MVSSRLLESAFNLDDIITAILEGHSTDSIERNFGLHMDERNGSIGRALTDRLHERFIEAIGLLNRDRRVTSAFRFRKPTRKAFCSSSRCNSETALDFNFPEAGLEELRLSFDVTLIPEVHVEMAVDYTYEAEPSVRIVLGGTHSLDSFWEEGEGDDELASEVRALPHGHDPNNPAGVKHEHAAHPYFLAYVAKRLLNSVYNTHVKKRQYW